MTRTHQQPMLDLRREGPLVIAEVGVDLAKHHATLAAGAVPRRHLVKFMIDTGAELSFIYEAIAINLGLRPIRQQAIVGISQRPETHTVYTATLHLGFEKPAPEIIPIPMALAGMKERVALPAFDGLLGRDFLASFDLAYSGPSNTFALRTERDWPDAF